MAGPAILRIDIIADAAKALKALGQTEDAAKKTGAGWSIGGEDGHRRGRHGGARVVREGVVPGGRGVGGRDESSERGVRLDGRHDGQGGPGGDGLRVGAVQEDRRRGRGDPGRPGAARDVRRGVLGDGPDGGHLRSGHGGGGGPGGGGVRDDRVERGPARQGAPGPDAGHDRPGPVGGDVHRRPERPDQGACRSRAICSVPRRSCCAAVEIAGGRDGGGDGHGDGQGAPGLR